MTTIEAVKQLKEIYKAIYRDPQNITRTMLEDMGHLIEEAIKGEEAQSVEPLTSSYVQPVPDKCDRITWRNHYYHLPTLAELPAPVEAKSVEPVMTQLRTKDGAWWEVAGGNEKAYLVMREYPGVYESRELFTRTAPAPTGERAALIDGLRESAAIIESDGWGFSGELREAADMLSADAYKLKNANATISGFIDDVLELSKLAKLESTIKGK